MLTKRGIVTKAVLPRTVTVTVHRSVMHRKYQKRYGASKKFLVDTAGQDVQEGDEVEIAECRPLSKRKHFTITAILKKAPEESRMQVREEPGLDTPSADPRGKSKSSPVES
jgi:small subunit ribosomal protein S17